MQPESGWRPSFPLPHPPTTHTAPPFPVDWRLLVPSTTTSPALASTREGVFLPPLPTMCPHPGQMINLIRNPFDSLAAERKRRLAGSHTVSPDWNTFVLGTTARWGCVCACDWPSMGASCTARLRRFPLTHNVTCCPYLSPRGPPAPFCSPGTHHPPPTTHHPSSGDYIFTAHTRCCAEKTSSQTTHCRGRSGWRCTVCPCGATPWSWWIPWWVFVARFTPPPPPPTPRPASHPPTTAYVAVPLTHMRWRGI